MSKKIKKAEPDQEEKEEYPLAPHYNKKEDIYNREKKEEFEEDELTGERESKRNKIENEGLDVPGAEDDDLDEAIGEEDEENNYYSLGGEEHHDLEEDQGQ